MSENKEESCCSSSDKSNAKQGNSSCCSSNKDSVNSFNSIPLIQEKIVVEQSSLKETLMKRKN